MDTRFVVITRPDGQKLYMNVNQIVYIVKDIVDETGSKTELLTTQGSFIIKKSLEEVIGIVSGAKKGEL